MPRPFPRVFLCCLLLGLIGCEAAVDDEQAPRPNIVLIMSDDMGYSDIGSYGGEIHTPHLDRLAENGILFTQFYNAGRCCPTRASLLSGRYPHEVGMGRMVSSVESTPEPGPYQGYLDPMAPTLAEVLQPAGYGTYMSGKWHVGEKPEHWPRRYGFDRYFGLISGASSYFELITEQPRVRQMALDDEPWEPPAEGFYMTDAFSDYAVQFLQEHHEQRPDDPYFLYVAYTAPHWPLHALPEDIARYQNRYTEGWDALREERFDRMMALGLIDERYRLTGRTAGVPSWQDAEDKDDWALRMAVYAAMIDRMDQGIGRILQAIEDQGDAENTLVLFLTDNGASAESIEGRNLHDPAARIGAQGSYVAYKEPWANASNTPLRLYKQWMHEGGIATPLIAYWPAGIQQPGRLHRQPGHIIDVMATVLELAGASFPEEAEPQKPLTGKSLAPSFANEPSDPHEALFWEHFNNRAVRKGPWKLVYDQRFEAWELYDIDADPTESTDLARQHPDVADDLRASWEAWAEDVGVFSLPN